MKSSCKLALFSDTESAHEGTSNTGAITFDPASTEILIELGRSLYKLMFQLLLLIESDHKIAINVINNLQQNEKMEDLSKLFTSARGALLRCIDDADMESFDTSTSTEGDITPTPSPGLPLTNFEFESNLYDLIDNQKWPLAITHVRQHKQLSSMSCLNFQLDAPPLVGVSTSLNDDDHHQSNGPADDMSFILNVYSQRLIKDRNGKWDTLELLVLQILYEKIFVDVFISSRTESELIEMHTILMENVYHVSGALANMEVSLKGPATSNVLKETIDIITTL